jgi:predicted transcriptional regulator
MDNPWGAFAARIEPASRKDMENIYDILRILENGSQPETSMSPLTLPGIKNALMAWNYIDVVPEIVSGCTVGHRWTITCRGKEHLEMEEKIRDVTKYAVAL